MFLSIGLATLVGFATATLAARLSRHINAGREIVVTLTAPSVAAALFFGIARLYVRKPFEAVGPEFGALVAVVAAGVFIANLALSLLYVSALLRRWPGDRHERAD
jgi:hypothetical protein